jgi:hypothetical protein
MLCLHEQFNWRRAGKMLLFSRRNMSLLCPLWHEALCRRIVHWWGASCTLGVFLEWRRASNSVGVLLGVKKGLELCGSSSWSEEGPRIVREFFLAWRGPRTASCSFRCEDPVRCEVLLEGEDVTCDVWILQHIPLVLKIVESPAPIIMLL